MTNYEKIKIMNIEEIALAMLCPFNYDLSFTKDCNGEMNKNCFKCTKEWLNKEIE